MQFKANNMKSPEDLKAQTHSKARTFSDVYSKNTFFKEMSQRTDTEREESLRIEEQPQDSQPNFFKKMSNQETLEYDSEASGQTPSSNGEPNNAFGENESYSEYQYFPNSQHGKETKESEIRSLKCLGSPRIKEATSLEITNTDKRLSFRKLESVPFLRASAPKCKTTANILTSK